jgi:CHAT domain-containing protein/Tfp pilus assembly protein PilF
MLPLLSVLALSTAVLSSPQGVIVEEVAKRSTAAAAGVQVGDRIVSWSRSTSGSENTAATGHVSSPFDLVEAEVEHAPRGSLVLIGRRSDAERRWSLPPARFGLSVRPDMRTEIDALYREGKDLLAAKNTAQAAEKWRAAAAQVADTDHLLASWLHWKAAAALAEAQTWPEADAAFEAAHAEAVAAPHTMAAVTVLRDHAETFRARRLLPRAEEQLRRALELDKTRAPETLSLAVTLDELGALAMEGGWRPGVGEPEFRAAFDIRTRLAPDSMPMARSWIYRGLSAISREDMAEAETAGRRALAMGEKWVPEDITTISILKNLGWILQRRGNYAEAEERYSQAVALEQKAGTPIADLDALYNELGIIAMARHDFPSAEVHYRKALEIREKTDPGGARLATTLNNFGNLMQQKGEPQRATEYFLRALAIKEKLAPESRSTAISLNNLGRQAFDLGDPASADQYFRRALGIYEKAGAGETVDAAVTLMNLAMAAEKRRDLPQAETYAGRGLALVQKLVPGTSDEADLLYTWGSIHRAAGRLQAAADFFLKSVDALEAQRTRLGGTAEAGASFAAEYAPCYHEAMTALVALGKPTEALHVLERSRARLWLARMGERDLLFTADLPADLARERREVDIEYDRVQSQMGRLDPAKDEAEIQKLRERLLELRGTQEEIITRIRKASPRLAALQYPEPLDLAGVQKVLDPGTTFLAYSVGKDDTLLFVVQQPTDASPTGLAVMSLPIGEKALREKVDGLRRKIDPKARASREQLVGPAADLYDLLIRPAEVQVQSQDRILISPDGPLHALPFGALVRREPRGAKAATSYLIEQKPLYVVPSATVYAELTRSRPATAAAAATLVAFGDPVYARDPQDKTSPRTDAALRSVERDLPFSPLPASRLEVQGIADLFGGDAQVYLGRQATEERAKSLDRSVKVVHFACHAFLDERLPLNSGLVLTIPESTQDHDNGLLQAWEVFDHVRLDADLVTLSGCRTALGKASSGEGLLGLTRAFHHAGARSVLGSLWSVSDRSTARLMKLFYQNVKQGKPRDEALRSAQLEFIRSGGTAKVWTARRSHPFHWAAFQLSGDWR